MRGGVVVLCSKEAVALGKWCLYVNVSTTCGRLIRLQINGPTSPTDFHYKACCSQLHSNLEPTSVHLAFMFCLRKVSAKSLRALFGPSPA